MPTWLNCVLSEIPMLLCLSLLAVISAWFTAIDYLLLYLQHFGQFESIPDINLAYWDSISGVLWLLVGHLHKQSESRASSPTAEWMNVEGFRTPPFPRVRKQQEVTWEITGQALSRHWICWSLGCGSHTCKD